MIEVHPYIFEAFVFATILQASYTSLMCAELCTVPLMLGNACYGVVNCQLSCIRPSLVPSFKLRFLAPATGYIGKHVASFHDGRDFDAKGAQLQSRSRENIAHGPHLLVPDALLLCFL